MFVFLNKFTFEVNRLNSWNQNLIGFQAGLQDRVVQVYQGLVFMDFDAQHMKDGPGGWTWWLDLVVGPGGILKTPRGVEVQYFSIKSKQT